jgi:hypothetical protein
MITKHLRMEPANLPLNGMDPTDQANQEALLFRWLRTTADKVVREMGTLDPTTPITDDELRMLGQCENYAQLRHTCNVLKMRRAENYPPDWWNRVMNSGLYDAIMERVNNPNNPDFGTQVENILFPMLGINR